MAQYNRNMGRLAEARLVASHIKPLDPDDVALPDPLEDPLAQVVEELGKIEESLVRALRTRCDAQFVGRMLGERVAAPRCP